MWKGALDRQHYIDLAKNSAEDWVNWSALLASHWFWINEENLEYKPWSVAEEPTVKNPYYKVYQFYVKCCNV